MRLFSFLFFLVALITLWFGLRPFNFLARNDVQVDTANSRALFNQTMAMGIQESRGAAFTFQPVTLNCSKGVTFHFQLTPQRRPEGLGHILYFYDGQAQAVFSITQWQDHLELFSRRPLATKGYQEASVRDILLPGKPISLTIISSPDGTEVFVNSTLVQSLKGFTLLNDTNNAKGQLIIGNDAHGTQPWRGSIEEIVLYNQSDAAAPYRLPTGQPLIRYTFDTFENGTIPNRASGIYALRVPERFTPLARNMLASFPLKELGNKWLMIDILVNIFGFIPLSLCFAIMLGRSQLRPWIQLVAAVFFCFLFSLAIETAQAYLPTRDSSLLDLLCNTLGGGVTAAIFLAWKYKNRGMLVGQRRGEDQ